MTKTFLLTGAAALAFTSFSLPAAAQDSSDEPEARQNTIVITGRKKEETVLDAPISVSAFSAETLEDFGAISARDVADLTPGLQINGDFGRTGERPVIRGISNLRAETPQPVGLFIDGVYVRNGLISEVLDNVERVEVLKGPQGALYGRSTYGGVINYISKTPSDEFEGLLSATVAEHDQFEASGRVAGPLANGLNAAIGGRYYEYGGEYENTNPNTQGSREIGEEKTTAVYANINFQPPQTPQFEGNFRLYHSRDEDGQFAGQLFDSTFNNSAAAGGTACPQILPTRSYFCGTAMTPDSVNIRTSVAAGEDLTPPGLNTFVPPAIAGWNFNAGLDREINRISGDFTYDINDNVSLTYLGGFTSEKARNIVNQSYAPAVATNNFAAPPFLLGNFVSAWVTDDENNRDYWSHELRLNGQAGDQLNWILGAFVYDEKFDNRGRDLLQTNLEFGGANSNEEKAIYGALDFAVTDAFSLGAEGRFYEEDVAVDLATGGRTGDDLTATFDGFTYRLTADYQFGENSLLYGSVSTGNKAGGFNSAVDPAANPELVSFDEELATQYEIGYKAQYYNGRVQFDGALYAIDLTDQQISQAVQLPNGRGGFDQVTVVLNAGETEIRGAEANIQADVTDALSLGLAWAYSDGEFTEGSDPTQGTIYASDTLVGFKVPRVSENSGTVSAQYTFPTFGGGWNTDFRVDGIYASSRYAQVQNLIETGDSFKTNARLTFANEDNGTELVLWGRNIFDDDAPANVFRYVDVNNFRFFARAHVVFLPRGSQFGATVRKRF